MGEQAFTVGARDSLLSAAASRGGEEGCGAKREDGRRGAKSGDEEKSATSDEEEDGAKSVQ
jgi:hypothetical protein